MTAGIGGLFLSACNESQVRVLEAPDDRNTEVTQQDIQPEPEVVAEREAMPFRPPMPAAKPAPQAQEGTEKQQSETAASQSSDVFHIEEEWQKANAAAMQAQREAVIAASRPGGKGSLVSSLTAPTPFDKAAWEQDPKATSLAYAQEAEPARARATSVEYDPRYHLELLTPSHVPVDPDKGTMIRFKAPPYAPISAGTADRITFPNGLCFTTVVADGQGYAELPVSVPEGTVNRVLVVCSSPIATEKTEVVLRIQEGVAR